LRKVTVILVTSIRPSLQLHGTSASIFVKF